MARFTNAPVSDHDALDVWLRFEQETDEESSHEANTFRTTDGFRIDWYHTAVGQVSSVWLDTYEDAEKWYEEHGYQDFSS